MTWGKIRRAWRDLRLGICVASSSLSQLKRKHSSLNPWASFSFNRAARIVCPASSTPSPPPPRPTPRCRKKKKAGGFAIGDFGTAGRRVRFGDRGVSLPPGAGLLNGRLSGQVDEAASIIAASARWYESHYFPLAAPSPFAGSLRQSHKADTEARKLSDVSHPLDHVRRPLFAVSCAFCWAHVPFRKTGVNTFSDHDNCSLARLPVHPAPHRRTWRHVLLRNTIVDRASPRGANGQPFTATHPSPWRLAKEHNARALTIQRRRQARRASAHRHTQTPSKIRRSPDST